MLLFNDVIQVNQLNWFFYILKVNHNIVHTIYCHLINYDQILNILQSLKQKLFIM